MEAASTDLFYNNVFVQCAIDVWELAHNIAL